MLLNYWCIMTLKLPIGIAKMVGDIVAAKIE